MSSELQSTLDAIDAVTASVCGWCSAPLGPDAVSSYFCCPGHQQRWHEEHSHKLTDYREPTDLDAYIGNQVELRSGECTPLNSDNAPQGLPLGWLGTLGEASYSSFMAVTRAQRATLAFAGTSIEVTLPDGRVVTGLWRSGGTEIGDNVQGPTMLRSNSPLAFRAARR